MKARLKPILVTAKRAAALCGLDVSTWCTYDAAELIPAAARLTGKCTRWCYRELQAWAWYGAPRRDAWEEIKKTLRRGRDAA
jgi:hypothetical protein